MKKGIIEIENMEFYSFHGCYAQEKIVGNKFIVNLSLEVDMEQSSKSDNITDAVSYLEVYEIVKKEMDIVSNILENVSDRILKSVERKFPMITSVTVKVSKMNPPLGGQVERVSVTQFFRK